MGIVKCSLSFWAMRGNYVGNYYNSNNNKLGNNNMVSAAIKLRRQRQGRRQREGGSADGGRVYAVFRTVVRDTDKSKGSPATCPASQRQIYPLAWPSPPPPPRSRPVGRPWQLPLQLLMAVTVLKSKVGTGSQP